MRVESYGSLAPEGRQPPIPDCPTGSLRHLHAPPFVDAGVAASGQIDLDVAARRATAQEHDTRKAADRLDVAPDHGPVRRAQNAAVNRAAEHHALVERYIRHQFARI